MVRRRCRRRRLTPKPYNHQTHHPAGPITVIPAPPTTVIPAQAGIPAPPGRHNGRHRHICTAPPNPLFRPPQTRHPGAPYNRHPGAPITVIPAQAGIPTHRPARRPASAYMYRQPRHPAGPYSRYSADPPKPAITTPPNRHSGASRNPPCAGPPCYNIAILPGPPLYPALGKRPE